MKQRHTVVPAAYMVMIQDGKILMIRRKGTGYQDGNYGLPAGHVKVSEGPVKAAMREAKEEIDVTINPKDVKIAHIIHRQGPISYPETNERVDYFFVASKWQGKIKNVEPHKCDDIAWFNLSELPKNTVPEVRHALEQIQKNNVFSELGF